MRLSLFLLTTLCFFCSTGIAQTIQQNSGWLFLMNTTKFNDKWGAHLDVQLRSANNWEQLRNFMFRPGVTYYINNKNEVTLGYLLNETFTQLTGVSDNRLTEHRIWQQYIYKHKISTILTSHRFRTEQRFIERYGKNDLFSQRFRYFLRFILPLKKGQENFDKGPFVALQNEVFLNLQNKDDLNGHVFDQNRAYGAVGYRLSKKLDIEAGYLNQTSKGLNNSTMNHAIQLALYTRF
ncbi:hypothetical protein CPT03_14615 [Pedobacter ginsengisoli]|uniref:DUF2490 domain-containing protein n=1 Tax=Pedobacter ginsengisoli TaxID=363852 RepID=A0A2D1U7P8_9SPHI|nr:DUF2490 domain-containing protein [Pedobacter ginsengisoli]ATP57618.1 hypothetical protein CPT03_14615 [Pedobacter ginsengisoli]